MKHDEGQSSRPASLAAKLRGAQLQAIRRHDRRVGFIISAAGVLAGAMVFLAIKYGSALRPAAPPVWEGPLPSPTAIAAGHRTILAGWHLVWDDEFASGALTRRLWSIRNFKYPYNNELQYYSAAHAQVRDGLLHILVTHSSQDGRPYTSAMLTTGGTMAWKYGLLVVRAKLPADHGLFSAIWMLPAHAGTRVLPEVDIMEASGSHPNRVVMTLHWGGAGVIGHAGAPYDGPNFASAFHTFALKWTPTQLTWYVDGVQRFQTTSHVPHVPMYLIMNVAVGGAFPGNPLPSDTFPQAMAVQYVRLYKPGNPSPPVPHELRPGG